MAFKSMNQQLRLKGILMSLGNLSFTEGRLRLLHRLSRGRKMPVKVDGIRYSEIQIPRPDGTKMRCLVFKPINKPQKSVPGVLWLHGGGYALGFPEMGAEMAKRMMAISQCTVLAPDYRLSPEAPYPAAVEDAYLALCYLHHHAESYQVDQHQIMVGGDSAGGGLTAALTLYARDKQEVPIAFQMPLYPMLSDLPTPSSTHNTAPVWNSRSNEAAWKLYLGELYGTDQVPAYAAPIRATHFSGLPPTATFVGSLEPFLDETLDYCQKLKASGIPVDVKVYEGCYHAFEQMCPEARISKEAVGWIMERFAYAVKHYRT